MRINGFLATTLLLAICGLGCGGGGSAGGSAQVVEQSAPSSGELRFADNYGDTPIEVRVQDQNGEPVSGVRVRMVSDAKQVAFLATDPQNRYFPILRSYDRAERGRLVPAVFVLVVSAIGVISSVVSIATHDLPSTSVMNVGGAPARRCLSGDLQDLLDVMGLASGVARLRRPMVVLAKEGVTLTQFFFKSGVSDAVVREVFEDFFDREHRICWNVHFVADGQPDLIEFNAEARAVLDALPAGVNATTVATGRATGAVARISVRNGTSDDVRFAAYPGMSFSNATSSERQSMTICRTLSAELGPYETREFDIFGACIHLHRGAPRAGDEFVPFREQRDDLIALGRAFDPFPTDESVLQDAIWVITDEEPPSDLLAVRTLFLAAGLDPSDYPALDGRTRLDHVRPAKLRLAER